MGQKNFGGDPLRLFRSLRQQQKEGVQTLYRFLWFFCLETYDPFVKVNGKDGLYKRDLTNGSILFSSIIMNQN